MKSGTRAGGNSDDDIRVVDACFRYSMSLHGKTPPADLPDVAFAGRSNVGKSSLMNRLMQRRNLVRTSGAPGCTRQINVFRVTLADRFALHLVDLPGFGFARRSKEEREQWRCLVEKYLRTRTSLAAIVLVVDIRRGIEREELMLIDFARSCRRNGPPPALACAATKLDKIASSAAAAARRSIQQACDLDTVACSAVTGAGCDKLWRQLRRLLPRPEVT